MLAVSWITRSSPNVPLGRGSVNAGMVDVIVSVGTNMFLNATLSCTLWFFDKRKIGTDRQNKILFINAQDIFEAHKLENKITEDWGKIL